MMSSCYDIISCVLTSFAPPGGNACLFIVIHVCVSIAGGPGLFRTALSPPMRSPGLCDALFLTYLFLHFFDFLHRAASLVLLFQPDVEDGVARPPDLLLLLLLSFFQLALCTDALRVVHVVRFHHLWGEKVTQIVKRCQPVPTGMGQGWGKARLLVKQTNFGSCFCRNQTDMQIHLLGRGA